MEQSFTNFKQKKLGNWVHRISKDLYISFNDFSIKHPLLEVIESLTGEVKEPETAFCYKNKMYILSDDLRTVFDEVKDEKTALKIIIEQYHLKKDLICEPWSDDWSPLLIEVEGH